MKRFIIRTLLICSPVIILYAYPVWHYARGESFGDLSPLGNYFFSTSYRSVMEHRPEGNRHVTYTVDATEECREDSDVLVIGDSFTQVGASNFMEYLQEAMPECRVLNIHTFRDGQEWHYAHRSLEGSSRILHFPGKTDVVMYLLNHAKKMPRTIVIESTEMWLMETVMRTDYTPSEARLKDYEGALPETAEEKNRQYNHMLNVSLTLNQLLDGRAFSFAHDWIKRRTGIAENPVKKLTLNQPHFSCPGESCSLYYLPYPMTWTEQDISDMRAAMARIIEAGNARGVHIIFMVTPLKQHMYTGYLPEGAVSEHFLSESLKDLLNDKHYLLCPTVLQPHIAQGEPDIFLVNDSHWSWKGAKYCAEALKHKIKDLCKNTP